MRGRPEQKLFLGLKVDAGMKRHIDDGDTRGHPVFKAGDPAHLEMMEVGPDSYVGRVLDAGFSIEQVEDLKRNIRSIVRLTFPDQKTSGSPLRIFAVEREEPESNLAAAG